MASTDRSSGAWVRIAFAMFAVGWGANQFSPMLIVYRHELKLGAGALAGLFLVYALTLIPGLLVGGPASDRFGRRPVVWPFVALSPLATLLLVLGPWSLVVIAVGRALAGLCSGVVFGAATAWVQEVSQDDGMSARRSALALTAGFGLGPVVAAALAQWGSDPLVVPYLPHLLIGTAAVVALAPTSEGTAGRRAAGDAGTARDGRLAALAAGCGTYPAVLAGGGAGQPAGVRFGVAGHRGRAACVTGGSQGFYQQRSRRSG